MKGFSALYKEYVARLLQDPHIIDSVYNAHKRKYPKHHRLTHHIAQTEAEITCFGLHSTNYAGLTSTVCTCSFMTPCLRIHYKLRFCVWDKPKGHLWVVDMSNLSLYTSDFPHQQMHLWSDHCE
jgi:hypothetical protein